MAKNHHDIPITQVRPRFQVSTDMSGEEIAEKLKEALKDPSRTVRGEAQSRYAYLEPLEKDQHYWSPRLSLTFGKAEDGRTLVRGLYGPRPTVWTLFVFFYALIGFAAFIFLIIGGSKLMMGGSGSIMWGIPILGLIFLSLYHVAYEGKKRGYDQSEVIHRFFTAHTGLEYD